MQRVFQIQLNGPNHIAKLLAAACFRSFAPQLQITIVARYTPIYIAPMLRQALNESLLSIAGISFTEESEGNIDFFIEVAGSKGEPNQSGKDVSASRLSLFLPALQKALECPNSIEMARQAVAEAKNECFKLFRDSIKTAVRN